VARVLADHALRRLLGSVLVDADEAFLNPNGIELRLGSQVLFQSTGESVRLAPGSFLTVHPGETVSISSFERLDFSAATVQRAFPDAMLMGLITPTTTMMREGVIEVATKVDAGFRGNLNWSLRNGSSRDLLLEYGEPIFKLTVLLLEGDEVPEIAYGGRPADAYQDTDGVRRSRRTVPVDVPDHRVVASDLSRLDPAKRLQEAGYPLDRVGAELAEVDGRLEVLSRELADTRADLDARTGKIEARIGTEHSSLVSSLEEAGAAGRETIRRMVSRRLRRAFGVGVGLVPIVCGSIILLAEQGLNRTTVAVAGVAVGAAVLLITFLTTGPTAD